MDSQDIRNLSEAYMEVYNEEKKPLPVDKMRGQMFAHRVKSNDKNISKSLRYNIRANRIDDTLSGKRKPQVSRGKYAEKEKENNRFSNRLMRSDSQGIRDSYEYDLYDIILSHLLDEGYAETPEAAEAIMVNMSEDWRDSICEELTGERKKRALEKGGYLANRVASGKEGQPVERRNPSGDITMRTTGKGPTKRGGSGVKGRTKSNWYGSDDTQGGGNEATRRAGKKVKDTSDDL